MDNKQRRAMEKIKVTIEINPAGWNVDWENHDESGNVMGTLCHDIKSALNDRCGVSYHCIETVRIALERDANETVKTGMTDKGMTDKELIAMYSTMDKKAFTYKQLLNYMYLARCDEHQKIQNKLNKLLSEHNTERNNVSA